jgi:uncharacterized protein YdcH (DUF465 family)
MDMGDTPHELRAEFPDKAERLHELKVSDGRASQIMEEYHAINRQIHRIETNVEPAADEILEAMKKQRLMLKDQIFALL